MINMKTLAFLAGLLLTQAAGAQTPTRETADTKGFWVIEGNPKKQHHTVIRYYNSERQLVAEEVVNKKWINLRRQRNIDMLNRRLAIRLTEDSTAQVVAVKPRN